MQEKNLRAYVAEMAGTFFAVLMGAGSVCASVRGELQPWTVLSVALATGIAYGAALAITLPISGGFLNPAVVIMLWVFRQLDGIRSLALIGVQLLGGILAGLVIRLLFASPDWIARFNHIGTPHVVESTLGSPVLLKAIGIEFFLTFCFVLVVYGTVLDPRARIWLGGSTYRYAAVWLGLFMTAATIVAFPLTGAALNPVRWFGLAIWEVTLPQTDVFRDHVPYWVGPIAGALLSGWLYTALILPPREENLTTPSPATPSGGSTLVPTGSRAKK